MIIVMVKMIGITNSIIQTLALGGGGVDMFTSLHYLYMLLVEENLLTYNLQCIVHIQFP